MRRCRTTLGGTSRGGLQTSWGNLPVSPDPFPRSASRTGASRRSKRMSNGDPVSWFVIEAGWKVVDAEGQEVGSVDEVVGDSGDDIFNGLSVSTGLISRPVYVPSEQVGVITQRRVQLKLTKDQVRHLGEYEEPPTSADIEPEEAGALRRAEAAIEAPIQAHEQRLNLVTRIAHAVRRALGRG